MCDPRQYDISWTRADWISIPADMPGRLNGDDFVMFKWDSCLPFERYIVIIQSLDTAGPPFRSIGCLAPQLRLPHVQLGYGSDIKIGVVPDCEDLPSFTAKLVRGSTYYISLPRGCCGNGQYMMERTGMDRPN